MTASLFHRGRESLKYRLFYGWCRFLEKAKSSRTELPRVSHASDLGTMITLCGRREVPYLAASLATLAKAHGAVPKITVYADSADTLQSLETRLGSCLPAISLQSWDTVTRLLPEAHGAFVDAVLRNGRQPVLVKKLAVLLATNLQEHTLFVDTDVLWNAALLPRIMEHPNVARMGLDWQRAYDPVLEAVVDVEGLLSKHPPLNSGFIYFPKLTLVQALEEPAVLSLIPHAAAFGWHGEQTLVAHAFLKLGGKLFDPAEVATTAEDNFRLRSSVVSSARHYAGCKHLFWRDYRP